MSIQLHAHLNFKLSYANRKETFNVIVADSKCKSLKVTKVANWNANT